jgi:Mg2+ and Co2+ transporter CorA
VADALDRVRPIFNVNQPAQEAALASLHERDAVAVRVGHARKAREYLYRVLADSGLDPLPSRANFVYADVPDGDADARHLLGEVFGFHPMAVRSCMERNTVPTVHRYEDYVFIVLHAPEMGEAGHVHLLELDLVVGHRYLVTVHGPINLAVDPVQAQVETEAVLGRLRAGRFRPATPVELSYAITSAVARRQSALIHQVAAELPALEKQVMASQLRDPEVLLEELFLIRHELITTRTMAAQCHDIWVRTAGIKRLADDEDAHLARDLADQFDRVRSLADGEAHFLFGVIELYQTKVHTKMTVAMERLAVIAAVTLPVTAIASVYGMNVIVNNRTQYLELLLLIGLMLAISLTLLHWARRQGWW